MNDNAFNSMSLLGKGNASYEYNEVYSEKNSLIDEFIFFPLSINIISSAICSKSVVICVDNNIECSSSSINF